LKGLEGEILEVKKLERATVLQTLVYLHCVKKEKKAVNITDIYKNVQGASETISSGVRFLAQNGLVTDEEIKSFPPQRVIQLTEAGEFVARRLAGIDEVLTCNKQP
jgi:predicted transcriptional regulator